MGSSRRLIESERTINDVSMGASLVSKAVDCSGIDLLSFDAVWTGTPTGTITVEISNVESPDTAFASADFHDLGVAGVVSPTGAGGNGQISINRFPFRWARWKYTRTGGTGTLNVYLQAKG